MLLVALPCAAAGGAGGFVHGLIIDVDGKAYYMAGVLDGPDGVTDIPGHSWKQTGPSQLLGKHYNTGPFGMPNWWSSDADDELLYIVKVIIDTWLPMKAKMYARRGAIHYPELLNVADGYLHPNKVVWLRHIAVDSFNFDGGPHPELSNEITPGVDWEFIRSGMMPYSPANSLLSIRTR